jgi:hypothetical protein
MKRHPLSNNRTDTNYKVKPDKKDEQTKEKRRNKRKKEIVSLNSFT